MSRTLLPLAGFEVITNGRFWVITEEVTGFTPAKIILYFDVSPFKLVCPSGMNSRWQG